MNKHLGVLMQKEMTRKEFLAILGLGTATVLGFGSIIHLLSSKQQNTSTLSGGYGSSVYGGQQH